MKVTFSVSGQELVDNVLKLLPERLSHSVVGAAHRAAAKPMVEKARLTAPEGPTGHLVDSIGAIKIPLRKADAIGEVQIGPRRKSGYKGFHGHLVERGTVQRQTKKGANRGIMPKHAFMIPAFESTKTVVLENIKIELRKKVLKLKV